MIITRMPFGKHRGERIAELPDDYVLWLTGIELRPQLRATVWAEVERRRAESQARTRRPAAADPAVAAELIAAGRRALANRYHPDRPGGDAARMQAVNAAADRLLAEVRA